MWLSPQGSLWSLNPDVRAPKEKDLLVPPSSTCAMQAHPTKLTPQSRVIGDFLQTSVLCSELGLDRGGKAATATYIPTQSQLTAGFWIRPYIQYFMWKSQTHNWHDHWATQRKRKINTSTGQSLQRPNRHSVQTLSSCIAALVVPASTKQLKANGNKITYTNICSQIIIHSTLLHS